MGWISALLLPGTSELENACYININPAKRGEPRNSVLCGGSPATPCGRRWWLPPQSSAGGPRRPPAEDGGGCRLKYSSATAVLCRGSPATPCGRRWWLPPLSSAGGHRRPPAQDGSGASGRNPCRDACSIWSQQHSDEVSCCHCAEITHTSDRINVTTVKAFIRNRYTTPSSAHQFSVPSSESGIQCVSIQIYPRFCP